MDFTVDRDVFCTRSAKQKLVKKIAMPASTDKIVCVCYRADYAVRTEAGCHEHSVKLPRVRQWEES